jgi:hypothetical protein
MVGYVVEFGEAIALNSALRLKLVFILSAGYESNFKGESDRSFFTYPMDCRKFLWMSDCLCLTTKMRLFN